MRRRPQSILKLKVNGPGIRPGRIPIPDLLVICKEAQLAVTRQAEALLGGNSLRPGPAHDNVRIECTLELFAIGKGSATMSFAAPEQTAEFRAEFQQELAGLSEEVKFPRLSEMAVHEVVQSIQEMEKGDGASAVPGVTRSLQEMGKVLVSTGVTSIEWIVPRAAGRKRAAAVFDRKVYEHIAPGAQDRTRRKPIELDGVLEMADFKESDLKCGIHLPDGHRATCSFETDLADDVFAALRHVARITGTAVINPATKRPEDIQLTAVTVLDPFLAKTDEFIAGASLEQLARAQGVHVKTAERVPRDVWPENEDVDAFLADIYRRRA